MSQHESAAVPTLETLGSASETKAHPIDLAAIKTFWDHRRPALALRDRSSRTVSRARQDVVLAKA